MMGKPPPFRDFYAKPTLWLFAMFFNLSMFGFKEFLRHFRAYYTFKLHFFGFQGDGVPPVIPDG